MKPSKKNVSNGTPLQGKIEDIRLYETTLSAEEIRVLSADAPPLCQQDKA